MGETIINDVLYTRIDLTATARVGDGSPSWPNAVSPLFSGVLVILPFVEIDSISCKVVEISDEALYGCSDITDIILPNTIETLKFECFSGNSCKCH